MPRRPHTGLAQNVMTNADKLRSWGEPMRVIRETLEKAGEHYADATNQAEVIERAMESLYDSMIDLSVLILKADKAKDITKEENEEYQSHEDVKEARARKPKYDPAQDDE